MNYSESVLLFEEHKKLFFEKYPTDLNAKEQIVFYANQICSIKSDLIRVDLDLFPYDTNLFLGVLKSKIQDTFNIYYREQKIIKDYSKIENADFSLKSDLFEVMSDLINEYKFKGFNSYQHIFNSFKGRAKKLLKTQTKIIPIKNYG